MKVEIISQPFDRNGVEQTLGDVIKNLLTSESPLYGRVWFVSAFVNHRALLHILPDIKAALGKGVEIHFICGIDHHSTTTEALQEILALGVESYIVHNPRPGHTFHPKIYLFESDEEADLIIGSNNLTEGGIFSNYEIAIRLTFDLGKEPSTYQEVKNSLGRFLNPTGPSAQSTTEQLLQSLVERGELITENQKREDRRPPVVGVRVDEFGNAIESELPSSPFGTEDIPRAPPLPDVETAIPKKHRHRETGEAAEAVLQGEEIEMPVPARGRLLWEKNNLPASDVQRQLGNPTGGLRLTQAGWEIHGHPIDQTTYFRYDLFGHLNWTVGKYPPKRQQAVAIPFRLLILGKNFGVQEMIISHKPSGEAGQGNYTTMFHWGGLGDTIQELNLVGKTFRIYAPSGEGEPYTVEIV
jgi:HKD family nuclease